MTGEETEFTVTIEFVGLCMFIPDRDARLMHVAMPHAEGNFGGYDVEEHFVFLAYDAAYAVRGSTKLSKRTVMVSMKGVGLKLRNSVPSGSPPEPVAGLPLVTRIAKSRVPRGRLNGKPRHPLMARVSLAGGAPGELCDGAIWELNGEEVELPPCVPWVMDRIAGPALELEVDGESGDAAPPGFGPFYPIDSKIQLYVLSLPPAELSDRLPPHRQVPPPPPDTVATHFAAYYGLVNKLPQQLAMPRFRRLKSTKGVSPVTCMGGSGEPCDPTVGPCEP